MFSRDFGRPKTAKFKIYLSFEDCRGFRCGSLFGAVVVSTGCRWCAPAPSLWVCSVPLPFLCPLSCFACGALHLNMALFRVLRGFRGFWGADVCLYGLRSLRGLCGFRARVELGGYMTCGVFAPIFSFFHLIRLSSGALPLLSSACPLGCLVCSCVIVGFVFSFSLSDYTQKERAQFLASSLVLLWACYPTT